MANYGGPSFPGLAASTGTRVDSSSKHIMACKVNDTLLCQWCRDQVNARNTLHVEKMVSFRFGDCIDFIDLVFIASPHAC